jgi:hypothetical protein
MNAQQPERQMNRAAIYVFRDAQCKLHGFTMFSHHFKTKSEADAYAMDAGHKFFKVVDFDDSGNKDSDEESKRRGGQW